MQQLERVNTVMTAFDQGAYMDFTRQVHESGFNYTGDRNWMPVYPALQAMFYRPKISHETLFRQGKYLNLILLLFLLAGLAPIFRRFFSPLHTLNLTLIAGFTVFIFGAGWFQSELLFCFLNFCLFVLFWRLLQRPSILLALVAGLLAALAYLTKASILPGLAIFAACAAAQWLWLVLHHPRPDPPAVDPETVAPLAANPQSAISHQLSAIRHRPSPWLYAAVVPIVLADFLLVMSPYLRQSKRVFGQYFYILNSTLYIWYDAWEQTKLGTRAHGDRVGWPDMPPDQIPSLSKYLRGHSPQQIAEPFLHGAHNRNSLCRSVSVQANIELELGGPHRRFDIPASSC